VKACWPSTPSAEASVSSPGTPAFAFCARGDVRNPAAYSGAPSSVLRSLAALGATPEVIDTELPAPFQRIATNLLALAFTSPAEAIAALGAPRQMRLAVRSRKPTVTASREMFLLLSAVAAARLRRRPEIVQAVQFGSEYRLPDHVSYVTLDDATILQLRRCYDYEWMRTVSGRLLDGMIARQRAVFRRARACCFLNHWAARSAVEDYGVPAERVHVVGAGANREIVAAERDWSQPRFLFVAMDFERKNGGRLLTAFSRVRADHPQARLDVVGRHPPVNGEGIVGHGLLRLDDEDEKRRLSRLFAESTCLVLPSLLEPTGNVHAEALAAGIGSIGTRRGGVSTLIGDAGVTIWPEDVDSLAAAMSRFCDPAVAREYGERARRRAPLFTWRAVAERLLRALRPPGVDADALAAFL